MRLQLRRTYLPDATVGVLVAGDAAFATIEDVPRAAREPNNQSDRCVPEGLYKLEPHDGARYVGTWALVNESLGVSHWPRPGFRSACVIHRGNTVADTLGCLLVANGLRLWPQQALIESSVAVGRLLALLGRARDQSHEIEIGGR